MSAPTRRDARALADTCAVGCWRQTAPHAVRPGGPAVVLARYLCPYGRAWATSWSTLLLPATSTLRRQAQR